MYKVEFISNWSSSTHPVDFPVASAHWSSLIGTTHKDVSPIFEVGVIASAGVEQVAETGGITLISQEINLLITAGLAYKIINGSGLGSGLGTITIENVEVDVDFPYISLLTMIAPSPDWIAQINNIKLTDASDNWLPLINLPVFASDAGSDNGSTYESLDDDTVPKELISSLENTPPFSDQIVGTFVLSLEGVLAVDDQANLSDFVIFPNPAKSKIQFKNLYNEQISLIELFSITGKKMRSINGLNSNDELYLGNLNAGVYILKLKTARSNHFKKLIIK